MIDWWIAVVVGVVCVVVQGFFSGSEIAIVSANRALLHKKARAGDAGAAVIEDFLRKPQQFLATTLIGTNLAAVTFSVVMTLTLISHGMPTGELVAVVTVTPFTLILGETVPKTLFQHNADAWVTRIARPMVIMSALVRPIVWLMSGFATAMTGFLGTERGRAFVTRDELVLLIESEGAGNSEISEDEREMIANVLEMSDRTVEDTMVSLSEVVALPETATVAEAAIEVADKQHTRIPIYRDRVDNIVGIVHAFDVLRAGAAGRDRPVSEIARSVTFVPESKVATDLLVELQGTGNQMAVVVDEYGGATGIVSIEDILEEIVGEIDDEYDEDEAAIRQEAANQWWIAARTSVERVNEELGLELPVDLDDFESIGGLVLSHLKRIPRAGASVRLDAVVVTVVAATERNVESVRLRVEKKAL